MLDLVLPLRWRRRSRKVSAWVPILPTGSYGSVKPSVWRDAARSPGSTPARRSTWPGSRKHEGTKRSRCTSLALSKPTLSLPMSNRPKPTTSRPWPWPRHSACAHLWPTATTDWACCMPRWDSGSKPMQRCAAPSRYTERWRWPSGSSRQRPRWQRWCAATIRNQRRRYGPGAATTPLCGGGIKGEHNKARGMQFSGSVPVCLFPPPEKGRARVGVQTGGVPRPRFPPSQPFPATASAEGRQFNGAPSPTRGEGVEGLEK